MFQNLVSGDKFRYQEEGYNLDLTYIHDNVIAMGDLGEGIVSQWRNDINEVARFFNSKYGVDNYLIFKLTEDSYDFTKFNNNVVEFPFPDHHPPPFSVMVAISNAMHKWLRGGPKRVAAVHCLAGRSRTGCCICGYLLLSGICPTAQEAITLFNTKRSQDKKNIVLPSQIRYVNYFEKMLKERISYPDSLPFMLLNKVTVSPVPLIESGKHSGGSITPFLRIYLHQGKKKTLLKETHASKEFWSDDPMVYFDGLDLPVAGDIEVILVHEAKDRTHYTTSLTRLGNQALTTVSQIKENYPHIVVLRYCFNTYFEMLSRLRQESFSISLSAPFLDACFAGPLVTNQYVSPDLILTLHFSSNSLATLHDDMNPPTVPRRTYQNCPLSDSGNVVQSNTGLINTSPPPYTAQPTPLPPTHLTAPLPGTGSRIDNHLQSMIERRNAEANPTISNTVTQQQQGAFVFQPAISPPPYSPQPTLTDAHIPQQSTVKRQLPQIPQQPNPEQLKIQQQQIQQQEQIQQQQQIIQQQQAQLQKQQEQLQKQRLVEIQQKRLLELQQQQQTLIQQQQQSQQQLQNLQVQLTQLTSPPKQVVQNQASNLPPYTAPQQQQLPLASNQLSQNPSPMPQQVHSINNAPNYNPGYDPNVTHTMNYQNNTNAYGGFVFTPSVQPATATYPPQQANPNYAYPGQNYPMNNQYQQYGHTQQHAGMEFPSF